MVLDLVHGWHDSRVREKFLEIADRVVGDTDGFNLACSYQLFHKLPCLDMRPVLDQVARSVGKFGEFVVVTCIHMQH